MGLSFLRVPFLGRILKTITGTLWMDEIHLNRG